jgi:hypothetical protein
VLQRGPEHETIGDLLSAWCDGGDAKACQALADAMEKDDPVRAGNLRNKACRLGDRSACEARK